MLVDETLVQYIQPPPYNPVNPAQYNLSSFYNTFNISANETNLAFIAGNAVYRSANTLLSCSPNEKLDSSQKSNRT